MERVEKLARRMAWALGKKPDEMVPRSGYPEDRYNLVPYWYFQHEAAVRAIAAHDFFKSEKDDAGD